MLAKVEDCALVVWVAFAGRVLVFFFFSFSSWFSGRLSSHFGVGAFFFLHLTFPYTGGTFWTTMPGMGISRWGSGVGGDVSRLEMLPLLFEGHW